MIIEAVVSSFILGLIRRGNIWHFGVVKIKGFTFFLIGAAMQWVLFGYANENGAFFSKILFNHIHLIHVLSYFCIIVPFFLNQEYWSFNLMIVGTMLNLIPIVFNRGKMPVALPANNGTQFDLVHTLLNSNTKFNILSDIIILDEPYPFPKILSIGDMFLIAGVFILIQQIMMSKVLANKIKSEYRK